MDTEQRPRSYSIERVLQNCVVILERIDVVSCKICNTVYCKEDFKKHLATHEKCVDTIIHAESTSKYDCKRKSCEDNIENPKIQDPFLVINEEIMSDISGDPLAVEVKLKKEITEENVEMSELKNSNNQITDVIQIVDSDSDDSLEFEKDASNCNTEVRNIKSEDTPQGNKDKESKENSVSEKRVLHNTGVMKCNICNKKFDSVSALKGHELIDHVNVLICDDYKGKWAELYPCQVCQSFFMTKYALRAHVIKHFELYRKRSFECHHCSAKFGDKANLIRHIRDSCKSLVHEPKPKLFKCQNCEAKFTRKYGLTRHIRKELLKRGELSDKRSFECHHCSANFGDKAHLVRHIRVSCKNLVHEPKPKLFKCQNCEARFTGKGGLTRHIRKELLKRGELSDKRSFECHHCSAKFGRKAHLIRHIGASCKNLVYEAKPEEKLFKCQNCEKKFARKDGLTRHMKTSCRPKPT